VSCPNPGPGNRDIGGGPIACLILIFVRDRPDGDPCVVGDGVVQRAKLTGSHRLDCDLGLHLIGMPTPSPLPAPSTGSLPGSPTVRLAGGFARTEHRASDRPRVAFSSTITGGYRLPHDMSICSSFATRYNQRVGIDLVGPEKHEIFRNRETRRSTSRTRPEYAKQVRSGARPVVSLLPMSRTTLYGLTEKAGFQARQRPPIWVRGNGPFWGCQA